MTGVKRILIVDDEVTLTRFLKELLLADGGDDYEVQTAASGEEALHLLQSHPYNLVLADLKMPGIDGLQLIEAVRQIDPETRTILMTAYGSDYVEKQVQDLSIFRYLPKPFHLDELRLAVREALAGGWTTSKGLLILSAERYEAIARRLYALQAALGCQCIFLANLLGQIILEIGRIPGLNLPGLATVVGERFAATFEMNRLLNSTNARNLDYHESEEYEIYSTSVGEALILLLLYERRVRSNRVGSVWEQLKPVCDDLREMVKA